MSARSIVPLLLVLAACARTPAPPAGGASAPVVEADSLVDRRVPGVEIAVGVPRLPDHAAASAVLRDSVEAFVRRLTPTEGPPPGSVTDVYDAGGGFETTLAQDGLYSTAVAVSVYAGGAHPNQFFRGLTVDLTTGRVLTAGDFFEPGTPFLDTLSAYVERAAVDRLATSGAQTPAEARAAVADYNDGRVRLAAPEIALTPGGVRVLVAPYEVLFYAAGGFEVDVPWAALGGMLRPGTPAARLAQAASDG